MFKGIADSFKLSLARRDAHVLILILLVAVFILFLLSTNLAVLFNSTEERTDNFFRQWVFLRSDMSLAFSRPWTFITSSVMHVDLKHLLKNVLLVYFLGSFTEDLLGKKHVWYLFFLGAIFGGLFFIAAFNIFPLFDSIVEGAYLFGASAGAMALMTGLVTTSPTYNIHLFGVVKIRVLWIAIFFLLMDLIGLVRSNSGGHFAHLGGMLFGFIYVRIYQGDFTFPSFSWPVREKKQKFKVNINEDYKPSSSGSDLNQDEIDAILDKISKSGYNSLSKSEKEKLFKASEKK